MWDSSWTLPLGGCSFHLDFLFDTVWSKLLCVLEDREACFKSRWALLVREQCLYRYQHCSGVLHWSPFVAAVGKTVFMPMYFFYLNRQASGRVKKMQKGGKDFSWSLTDGISALPLIAHPVFFPLDHSSHSCCSLWVESISKLLASRKSAFPLDILPVLSAFHLPIILQPCFLSLWLNLESVMLFWNMPGEILPPEGAELTLHALVSWFFALIN